MQRKAAYKRVSLELQPTNVSSSLDRNHQQQRQISDCDCDCDYDNSIYHNSDGITTSMRNNNNNHNRTINRTIIRNKTRQRKLGLAFWIAGVLNNAGYVIMIAAAKSISEGGVALVFLANILPALVVKATAPYWFETISYHCRLRAATGLMVLSFGMVASCRNSLQWQLAGVACTSAQASLGEASLLALAGKMDGELELVQAKANQAAAAQAAAQAALEEESLKHKGEHNNGEGSNPNGTSSSSLSSNKGGISICLNGFSSGTGFAGVFGFFWVWFWNHSLGFSLSATLWLAMVLAAGYLVSYTTIQRLRFQLLQQQQIEQIQQQQQQQHDGRIQYNRQQQQKQKHDNNNNNKGSKTELVTNETAESSLLYGTHENDDVDVHNNNDDNNNSENEEDDTSIHDEDEDRALVSNAVDPPDSTSTKTTKTTTNDVAAVQEISSMTSGERFYLVLTLWPYMIPLFTVYVAEYTLQSGTWTAIGFPTVASKESRDTFYRYSNWTYQVGVFISRSSGTCMVAPMALLWAMPFLQCANVVLYWAVAAHQSVDININDDIDITTNDTIDASLSSMVVSFVSSPYFLYPGALYAGLLGGAVYVHGYLRICKDLPLPHREFALSATSLAECLGIVVADVLGLLVQACLYQIHGLDGAVMACPN